MSAGRVAAGTADRPRTGLRRPAAPAFLVVVLLAVAVGLACRPAEAACGRDAPTGPGGVTEDRAGDMPCEIGSAPEQHPTAAAPAFHGVPASPPVPEPGTGQRATALPPGDAAPAAERTPPPTPPPRSPAA